MVEMSTQGLGWKVANRAIYTDASKLSGQQFTLMSHTEIGHEHGHNG